MKKISLFDIPDADERGVSPVIGVILMVAITVILAAVIATFVLGFPDQVNDNVKAGADISSDRGDPGSIQVTWISEGSAENLNVTVSGANVTKESFSIGSVGDVADIQENNILDDPTNQTEYDNDVTVVVTATKGDTSTVVSKDTVTV